MAVLDFAGNGVLDPKLADQLFALIFFCVYLQKVTTCKNQLSTVHHSIILTIHAELNKAWRMS